ncbi:MAG: hypothetical protein WAL26_03200, partial [Mycobacterium sp.]
MAHDLDGGADQAGDLPATVESHSDEIVVSVQPEGLLVGGDPDAVESYLKQIQDSTTYAMQVVGVDKASLGNATGVAASAASLLGQSAKFVQLHPESVKALDKY